MQDPSLVHIPPIALSPYEWPEYYVPCLYPAFFKPESVGRAPLGARWGIWPIYFEEYKSDIEPTLENSDPDHRAPNRLIFWQRIFRTDVPPGWHQLPPDWRTLWIGFSVLTPTYYQTWKRSAKYYRNRWQRGAYARTYTIETIGYDEFVAAYAKSTVAKEISLLEPKRLQERLRRTPDCVHMWGVRRVADKAIVAGLTSFDSPSAHASHYGCGFYLAEVASDHPMVALMDQWYADSVTKNIQVLHLGTFLPPTETKPPRMRAISDFKAQFITHYQHYQPPLIRFVRGRLFRKLA